MIKVFESARGGKLWRSDGSLVFSGACDAHASVWDVPAAKGRVLLAPPLQPREISILVIKVRLLWQSFG